MHQQKRLHLRPSELSDLFLRPTSVLSLGTHDEEFEYHSKQPEYKQLFSHVTKNMQSTLCSSSLRWLAWASSTTRSWRVSTARWAPWRRLKTKHVSGRLVISSKERFPTSRSLWALRLPDRKQFLRVAAASNIIWHDLGFEMQPDRKRVPETILNSEQNENTYLRVDLAPNIVNIAETDN